MNSKHINTPAVVKPPEFYKDLGSKKLKNHLPSVDFRIALEPVYDATSTKQ